MQFATKYNFKQTVTPSGTLTEDLIAKKKGESKLEPGYEYDYKEFYDSNGKRELKIVGRHSVYEKIQSFKNDVDIYKILARYMNGDLSALDRNKGFYADISSIPNNFNDFHNKIVEGQAIFGGLPTDFKEQFGNNINEFMTSIYDKSFERRYNEYVESKRKPVSAPVSAPVDNGGVENGNA